MKATEALEKTIKDFKNKMDSMEIEIIEKNKVITQLGDKIKILENRKEAHQLNEKQYDDELKKVEEKIDTYYFNYILDKEKGINIYPNMFCEKCNIKLRLRDYELGKHMEQVHRFFRCTIEPDCTFEGESYLARKVHIKEIHRRKNKF